MSKRLVRGPRWWSFGVLDWVVDAPPTPAARLAHPPGNWTPAWVHPVLRERVARTHARFGLWIASGWRSSQRQKELFDCYRAGDPSCSPANPPGSSNHEAEPYGPALGLAVDMHPAQGSDYGAMQRIAREEGIAFPIAREAWHGEPIENPTPGRWGGFPAGW